MTGFGGAAMPLMSCIALLVGATLLILGFATNNWAFDGTHYLGLWRYGRCILPEHQNCYGYDQPSLKNIKGWLHVTRGLECVAIVLVSFPLVTLPIYMYIALGMYYKCMMLTMCIMTFLSSACGFVGAGIYAYNIGDNNWDVSWSIIVLIVGCAFILIGFLVLLVALISKRPESLKDTGNFYPATVYIDQDTNKIYTVEVEED